MNDNDLLTEAMDAGLFDTWGLGPSRKDSLYIGESPWGAECAQLGTDGYAVRARRECQAFIEQIRRHYGSEPAGGRLFVKANPHDFGTYYSVEVEFSTPDSEAYAFAIEGDDKGVLEEWDEDATRDLERGIHGRSQE